MVANIGFVVPVVLALLGSLALTPLVRFLSVRWGMVAAPRPDRWHQRPTALFGGVAIFLSVMVVELLWVPLPPRALTILGAAAAMFVLGLIDDLVHLKPMVKLAGQVAAALAVVADGTLLPWTWFPPQVNAVITLLWLVGLTNAVNLLDNMDGLAAGISLIASACLGFHLYQGGEWDLVQMVLVFAAALLGFLVYNTNPASIFMGDCGSLFLGFFLGGAALLDLSPGRSRSFLPVLAVPVLILFIPIFDTLFVMVLRKLAGRPVSRGGRDHTSHRLVALGLSERRAVWLLYGLAALSGLLGILVSNLPVDVGLAAITSFTLVLTMLGVHLARVRVYDPEDRSARPHPILSLMVDLSQRRRIFEVFLDAVLIALAYYVAHTLFYGAVAETGDWRQLLQVILTLIPIKLLVFLGMGVYRGLWQHVGLRSLGVYARAVLASSIASLLILLFTTRFQGLSRVIFVLDGLLLLALITGSRLSFRMFRRLLRPPVAEGRRRVLILGAGEAGALLARELANNLVWGRAPVGFLDDDPFKSGRMLEGLPILGGPLAAIRASLGVDEVVISTGKISNERLCELIQDCQAVALPVSRLSIRLDPVELEDLSFQPPGASSVSDRTPESAGTPTPNSHASVQVDRRPIVEEDQA
jgi:UDP-GlcNAc:undecaprenyl-phosphate GlcNAc-1-phosphate transferase